MQGYFRTILVGSTATGRATADGKSLSVDDAIQLQNEIAKDLMSIEIQQKLWSIADGDKMAVEIAKLGRDVHSKVITKYGFPATGQGIILSQKAYTPQINGHPDIKEKSPLLEYLLSPEVQLNVAKGSTAPPKGITKLRAQNPNPSTWDIASGDVWKVVGGSDKGGILVRQQASTNSAQLSMRLSTGATVEELERVGDRLKYSKLTGDGPDFGWVTIEKDGSELVKPFLYSGPRTGTFMVVHDKLAQRAEPKKDAEILGALLKHAVVKGKVVDGDGTIWLMVKDKGVTKYMMIDGASLGLAALMKEVGDARKFKVVNDRVAMRSHPSVKAEVVGAFVKSTELEGSIVAADGIDWLMTAGNDSRNVFVLIDGEQVGLGLLLEELDRPRTFKVVHPRVAVRSSPSQDAPFVEWALKNYVFTGSIVVAESEEWLKVKEAAGMKYLNEVYMLIDGSSMGHGALLEEVVESKPEKSEDEDREKFKALVNSIGQDKPKQADSLGAIVAATEAIAAKVETISPSATKAASKLEASARPAQAVPSNLSTTEKVDLVLERLAALEAKVERLSREREI